MKYISLFFFTFITLQLSSQNFTTPLSFINFIEGEWEKIDTPDIYNLNSSNYLRFKFEKIVGDSLNINVSAKSNTTNPLQNMNFNCQTKNVTIDNDSTYSYAYFQFNVVNPGLMYRFDSIDSNIISLKMKMSFWTAYSEVYYFKRVGINDTLIVGSSCDTMDIIASKVPFGCSTDSIFTAIDYSRTYVYEKSTVDSTEVGVFVERYQIPNSCDSVAVSYVELLDSATLYLADFLVGEWEWIYTYTGWGYSSADSFDYVTTMKIFQNDSINYLPYSYYIDDTLEFCSNFYLLSNSRLNNQFHYYFLVEGNQYRVYQIDSITIAMEELFVADGPTNYWKKISNSTFNFDTLYTCNIEDVGTDTIYSNLCDSSSTIISTIFNCPNAINEINNVKLKLIPNPSSLFIKFIINESINVDKIEVFNVGGQSQKIPYVLDSNMLDISQLEKGLYFIKLSSKEHTFYAKFVKE